MLPGMELMSCPNMAVPREVMHHVVRVESSYNPYAIGVVGGRLVRQPRNLPEALATVRMLEDRGYNFSLGLAQVNRYNLVKYGLDSYQKAFQPCANLVAGSRILRECYGRSGGDWGKSFSCYYSGDFVTGYRHGYVQKVYASMRRGLDAQAIAAAPIQVVDRASRRVAGMKAAAPPPAAGNAARSLAERRVVANASPASVPSLPPVPAAAAGVAQPAAPMRGVAMPTAIAHPPVRVSSAASASSLPITSAVAAGDSAFVF